MESSNLIVLDPNYLSLINRPNPFSLTIFIEYSVTEISCEKLWSTLSSPSNYRYIKANWCNTLRFLIIRPKFGFAIPKGLQIRVLSSNPQGFMQLWLIVSLSSVIFDLIYVYLGAKLYAWIPTRIASKIASPTTTKNTTQKHITSRGLELSALIRTSLF